MAEYFDNKTYQTGHTAPPKSRGGLIALLLGIIILLFGIISVLGLLNIHLFRQLMNAGKDEAALAEVVPGKDEGQGILDTTRGAEQVIRLDPSPQSQENYPQTGSSSLQEIYAQTVVSLACVETDLAVGTGIILTSDGYILTNSYMVQGVQQITVRLTDGRQLPGFVVGKDSFSDLAVLKVDALDLVPARFGDSTALRVGDPVVAIGNPVGSTSGPMTDGIISAINADIPTGSSTMTLLQTNAIVSNESIGGPLINCYGQIIGINTNCAANVLSVSDTARISYALDSITIKHVADQLIAQGFVSGRVHLGIQGHEIDEFYENYYDIPQGIFITALDEESVLYQKGVREGDILLNLANTRILDFDTLNSLLSRLDEGQEVTAVVYRDGTTYQLKVTIGALE